MKVQTFFIGIIAAFALPWLLVIAYPTYKAKNQDSVKFEDENGNALMYHPKQSTRVAQGEKIYMQENCQACHTQVIRPTTTGTEVHRVNGPSLYDYDNDETVVASWAGTISKDSANTTVADTRRESISQDYLFDSFAAIGERRIGPDLMNVGARFKLQAASLNKAKAELIKKGEMKPVSAEELIYLHLYNARKDDSPENGLKKTSTCPPNMHLFDKISDAGQGAKNALPIRGKDGYQIVPSADAIALADYILSRDNHDQLPASMDNGPKEDE